MSKRLSWLPHFLSYFIICFLLLVLSFGTRLPFVYGLSEIVLHPFRASSYSFLTALRAGSQDTVLKQENVSLHSQLSRMQEIMKDDAALRDQFQTTQLLATKLLPSRILAQRSFIPGVSLPETLVIDRGQSDGVQKGLAVVVKDNLIGVVSIVSPHASVVTLVTNAETSLTSVTESQTAGIVRGHGKGSMTYENVFLSDSLRPGDLVVTRGAADDHGSGVPPNLVIGRISSVHKQASNLFQNAELTSLIDVTKLTMVFVITR